MTARVLLAAGLAGLAGCTFSDGRGWLTLEAAVKGHAEEELVSDRGARVTLTAASAEITGLRLLAEESTGGSAGTFDPASPPEGYGLCHSGHCHADDGRLVSYEEVAAEMAAGGTRRVIAEELGADLTLDLLGGGAGTIGPEELGDVALGAVTLVVGRFSLAGTADVGGTHPPFTLELAPEGGLGLSAPLVAALGRGGESTAELVLTLHVPDDLLDGIAFENLTPTGGTLLVDATHNAAVAGKMASLLADEGLVAAMREDEEHHEQSLEEKLGDVCAHFALGPFEGVVAASEAGDHAPVVEAEHRLMEVELPADAEGFLTLEVAAEGHHLLALAPGMPRELRGPDGAEVQPAETAQSYELCPAIGFAAIYELVAGSYSLGVGPATGEAAGVDVDMVFASMEEGDEHDHE